jgi:hypothetical protein
LVGGLGQKQREADETLGHDGHSGAKPLRKPDGIIVRNDDGWKTQG